MSRELQNGYVASEKNHPLKITQGLGIYLSDVTLAWLACTKPCVQFPVLLPKKRKPHSSWNGEKTDLTLNKSWDYHKRKMKIKKTDIQIKQFKRITNQNTMYKPNRSDDCRILTVKGLLYSYLGNVNIIWMLNDIKELQLNFSMYSIMHIPLSYNINAWIF